MNLQAYEDERDKDKNIRKKLRVTPIQEKLQKMHLK